MMASSGDINVVFEIFSGTVNPAPAIREQAENQLKQVHFVFFFICITHFCLIPLFVGLQTTWFRFHFITSDFSDILRCHR